MPGLFVFCWGMVQVRLTLSQDVLWRGGTEWPETIGFGRFSGKNGCSETIRPKKSSERFKKCQSNFPEF
jgi:hypothetical protein